MKKRIITIGDVFEIPVTQGFAYGQVTHIDGNNGEVVRILNGIFPQRQTTFGEVQFREKRFVTIIPLRYMSSRRYPVVENRAVPATDRDFPKFRSGFPDMATGKYIWNSIYDGSDWTPVKPAHTAQIAKLPIHEVLPEATFIDRVENLNWKLEDEQ